MKKALIVTALFIVAGTLPGFAQKKVDTAKASTTKMATKPTRPAKQYTCPMHPDVVTDKPGKCPQCGMKLIARKGKKK